MKDRDFEAKYDLLLKKIEVEEVRQKNDMNTEKLIAARIKLVEFYTKHPHLSWFSFGFVVAVFLKFIF